ncbi:D-alanyl-D-alanine carboxypeptidase/D-alanyl-D-alanine-endopeptidase [Synechococcus sp. PROS-U-1]|uniref:D-alanyl-D-alanine carboxypeptidase/D-alanyl-D-alanine endopeptidase n=1 Tax=Synechococcus sp. PROS-U-1 TaxID=1400866 RepID=UPI0016475898|nr:D-alanyl-D-alanine carboxypeptidase/D-alanyl-D-alanine-endopeptidase [Synechococcus sp. PROS-U-1]QNJ03212.1 penicillin-binding-like protein Pbp4 [Synechococcus sp. PROS-U-1]
MIRSALFSLLVLAPQLPLRAAPPLLAPPPVVQRQGQALLTGGALCPALQSALETAVGPEQRVWSVSVLDQRGQLLADLNGGVPRVPASNQKLVSTAFALDRLGPDFRLKTQLLRHADGTLEIVGEGDPDLSIAEIQKFAMVALGQGGSRTPASVSAAPVQLMVREEPRQRWWPADWEPADRSYAYGAPITRLALTSNALHMAVMDPAARLERILNSTILQQGGQIHLQMVDQQAREAATARSDEASVVLHSEDSAPMHALLSLANTESHNFTAEVLMREAADAWDVNRAALATTRWMQTQGLPMSGLRVRDGSGLSRGNRLTSRSLSVLLWRMAQHPLAAYYQASMAIAGQRGTLRNFYRGTSLQGRFWGKTGTLTGVRSISGILETADGPRYVSMISNGAYAPNSVMGQILLANQRVSRCPAWNADVMPRDGRD